MNDRFTVCPCIGKKSSPQDKASRTASPCQQGEAVHAGKTTRRTETPPQRLFYSTSHHHWCISSQKFAANILSLATGCLAELTVTCHFPSRTVARNGFFNCVSRAICTARSFSGGNLIVSFRTCFSLFSQISMICSSTLRCVFISELKSQLRNVLPKTSPISGLGTAI